MDDSYSGEWLKLRLLLGGIVIFLVSGLYSCSEINYLARGRTVAATNSSVRPFMQSGRYNSGSQMLQVSYEFPDVNGAVRKEYDTVPADWPLPSGPVVIQYIPMSPDSSRLDGHREWWAVTLFAFSFVPIGFACYKFWKFYKS